jgi:hypothetical protein
MTTKNHIRLIVVTLLCHFTAKLSSQRNIYAEVTNSKEVDVPEENYITAINAGAVFGIGNYFYAGGGINATKVWGAGYSSLGLGAGPEIQVYMLKKTKVKLFLEGKGRVMYFFPEYPGTELNFAFWGGPAVELFLSERNKLKFGFFYNHLSNAKADEQYMNKSLDGLGINIGWVFY